LTLSAEPKSMALCRGVIPRLSLVFTSAPTFGRSLTTSSAFCPLNSVIIWSGVSPVAFPGVEIYPGLEQVLYCFDIAFVDDLYY